MKIPVKLSDKQIYDVPESLITFSVTLFEKCLAKEKLNIQKHKPIVATRTSLAELILFSDAIKNCKKNSFSVFYDKLGPIKQNELISTCGIEKLNSPFMTCVLAQKYLSPEIFQTHIIPHMEQDTIELYLQSKMIVSNISKPKTHTQSATNQITTDIHGHVAGIPDNFEPHSILRTSRNSFFSHENTRIVAGNENYHLFSVRDGTGTYNNYIAVKNHQQGTTTRTKLPEGPIVRAVCSSDTHYMVVQYKEKTKENTLLLEIDCSNKSIITNTLILPASLQHSSMRFNPSSTALFYNSSSRHPQKESFFCIYDLTNKEEHISYFDYFRAATSFNKDFTRMAIGESKNKDSLEYSVTIYGIKNLYTYPITTIDLPKNVPLTSLKYSPKNNLLAIRLSNKNIFLIKESKSGVIKQFHMLYPHVRSGKVCTGHLLFTHDGHFCIDVCKEPAGRRKKFVSQIITIWNIKEKKYLTDTDCKIHKTHDVEIIMNKNENSFIVPKTNNTLWYEYTLYTRTEQETCQFVKTNQDLLMAYILRRLFIAKKIQQNIIPEHIEIIKQELEKFLSVPKRVCIRDYLAGPNFTIKNVLSFIKSGLL